MKNVWTRLAAITLLALPFAAAAQSLEPGEWQFTTTTSMPGMGEPRSFTNKQCVKKEDASKLPWERQDPAVDCKTTALKKSGNTVSWEVSCPKMNMQGRGSAQLHGSSLESEMTMVGENNGQKMEVRSKTTGKRLGPCKS